MKQAKEGEEKQVTATGGCPGCAVRDQRIAQLQVELEAALKRAKDAEERLGQNSRNSHKPPSADPPNTPPKPPKPKGKRRRGGQPGHKGKKRELIPTEEVDKVVVHRPSACEGCGESLPQEPQPEDPAPERHQVFDLPERPREVIEHQAHTCNCPHCGHVNRAEIPKEVAGSNFGPRLTAVMAFLVAACQLSRRQVEEVVEDVFGIPIALGTISNLEQEVSEAVAEPVEEAAEEVRKASVKNVDETGWKKVGKKCWLWTAATLSVAIFTISNRGKRGLRSLLGEKLLGIFTSDRWGVYKARAVRFRQLCWSHLLRDFQKVIDRGDKAAKIGKRAKGIAEQVFMLWRDFKAGGIDRETLKKCLRPLRKELKSLLQSGAKLEGTKAATFCQNLLDLEPAMWTFMRCEGVEPTNNLAERVLRRGVLWRKRSFGSQSDNGCTFVARMLTVVQSRRLQKRPVLSFLVEAVTAHRSGSAPPSLIPS